MFKTKIVRYPIMLLYILSMSVNASAFDCKNKVQEYQWDAYIQAIQAASPFIGKGESLIVFSDIRRHAGNSLPIEPEAYFVLTSDYKLYKRSSATGHDTCDNSLLEIRDNYLKTELIDSIHIREVFEKDTTGLIQMFNPTEYLDCYITESEGESIYFHNSEFFYAMLDKDGKVHGATTLYKGQETPFDANFLLWMTVFISLDNLKNQR